MFDKIKRYYDSGLWDIQRVYNVVGKAITQKEYEIITETAEEPLYTAPYGFGSSFI